MIQPTNKEYFDYKNASMVNGSVLKCVLQGKNPHKAGAVTDALSGSSLVDAYLTMPDLVDDLFTVFNGEMPSERVQQVVELAFAYRAASPRITDHKDVLVRAARELDFDRNKADETLATSICDKAGAYWAFLHENVGTGKQVVDEKTRSFAYEISQKVLRDPVSGKYFYDWPGIASYSQRFLYGDIEGHAVKSSCDLLLVAKKTVTIVEIKTMYQLSLPLFFEQAKEHWYPGQVSYQREVVRQNFPSKEVQVRWLLIGKDITGPVQVNVIDVPDVLMDMYEHGQNSRGITGWRQLFPFALEAVESKTGANNFHKRRLDAEEVLSYF
jgi:hypothetical protein